MDRRMHLDYTTFQGQRIPYFKSKQDAEQALLGGLIKDGQQVAIGRDSFKNAAPGSTYVYAQGFAPVAAARTTAARLGASFAGREATTLAARQAAQRAAAARAAQQQAAAAAAKAQAARTAAERQALIARQEAAARVASQRAAAEHAAQSRAAATAGARSATGFAVKGGTIAVVTGTAIGGGTALVAQLKRQPETKVTDLPNGHKLLTFPDGSWKEVDENGKEVDSGGPGGAKGTLSAAGNFVAIGAVAAVVIFGGVALNRSHKAKTAATAAASPLKAAAGKAKAVKVPANLKALPAAS